MVVHMCVFVTTDPAPCLHGADDSRCRRSHDPADAPVACLPFPTSLQLLQHPVVLALDNTAYAWLHELLRIFNAGDLHGYDAACIKYAASLNAQPALLAHERRLHEKVRME